MAHHLWCGLYTLLGDFMNREGELTFGGRNPKVGVNHVHFCLLVLLRVNV